MVVSCVVVGYTSRCADSSLSFHRIPKEEKRRQLWLNAIKSEHWKPRNLAVAFMARVVDETINPADATISPLTSRRSKKHFIQCTSYGDSSSDDFLASVVGRTTGGVNTYPSDNITDTEGHRTSNTVPGRVRRLRSNYATEKEGNSPSNNATGSVRKWSPRNNVTSRVKKFFGKKTKLGHSPRNSLKETNTEEQTDLALVSNKISSKRDIRCIFDGRQPESPIWSEKGTPEEIEYTYEGQFPSTPSPEDASAMNAYLQDQSPDNPMSNDKIYLQDQSPNDPMSDNIYQDQLPNDPMSDNNIYQDQPPNDPILDNNINQEQSPDDIMYNNTYLQELSDDYLQDESPENLIPEAGSDPNPSNKFQELFNEDEDEHFVPIVCSSNSYFWQREEYQGGISLGSRLKKCINYICKSDTQASRTETEKMLEVAADLDDETSAIEDSGEDEDSVEISKESKDDVMSQEFANVADNEAPTPPRQDPSGNEESPTRQLGNFNSTLKYWRGVERIMVPNFGLLDDSETSVDDLETEDHLCFGDTGNMSQGHDWAGGECNNINSIEKPGYGDGNITDQSRVSYRRRSIGRLPLCFWWSFTVIFLILLVILLLSENLVPGIFSKHLPCECFKVLQYLQGTGVTQPQDDGDL